MILNSSKDKNWHIHERVALGNKNKKIKINISKKIDSSSILKVKKNHIKIEPDSKIIKNETVNMIKLEKILSKYINKKNCYLKIDTQGYEYPILLGSGNFLKNKVLKFFDYEVSGSLSNSEFLDRNGFFVGNHHYDLTSELKHLQNTLNKFL